MSTFAMRTTIAGITSAAFLLAMTAPAALATESAPASSVDTSQSSSATTVGSSPDSTQSEATPSASPAVEGRAGFFSTTTNSDPATPTLPSLDFSTITPDDKDLRMPISADRFKQADGTFKIPAPQAGGQGAGYIAPGLEAFYNQKLQWESCEDFDPGRAGEYGNAEAQCAYLIVPLDYSKPNGATIAIGLYKVPARDQQNKIGTLFVDPGGPGGSGMSTAHSFANSGTGIVRERFDYIGFDPRGVGSSLPMVRCQSSDAFDKQRQDNDWYTAEQYNAIAKYNTDQCYTNTGTQFNIPGGDFIANVGTVNVIKDLDIARAVVGDSKINYLGYSYGTSIGYQYAMAFPDNIRTMVIDGVVNPFENNPEEATKYSKYTASTSGNLDSELSQMQGFQATFDQYLKKCAQDNGFNVGSTKIPCATGTNPDPKAGLAEYQKIARSTWQNSTLVSRDGRKLSFFDMSQATILAMYDEGLWKYLNLALSNLKRGGSPSMALTLADWYYDRQDDGTYDYGTMAAFPSIWCTDAGTAEGANEEPAQLAKKKALFQVAPFLDPGTNPDGSQRLLRAENDWCTYYKNTHTLPLGKSLSAMPNILVISTTYDPSTPYQDGVVAADALDGTLLTVAGNSHTAYAAGSGTCASDITEKYLETMIVPTDIVGEEGVQTKDLESNVITGNECRIDSFRPTPALQPTVTHPGKQVSIRANGLVRNSSYTVTLPEELGKHTLVGTTNEQGELTVTWAVPAQATIGTYTLALRPTDLALNDPTMSATSNITIAEEAQQPEPPAENKKPAPAGKPAPGGKQTMIPGHTLASTGATDVTTSVVTLASVAALLGATSLLRRRK